MTQRAMFLLPACCAFLSFLCLGLLIARLSLGLSRIKQADYSKNAQIATAQKDDKRRFSSYGRHTLVLVMRKNLHPSDGTDLALRVDERSSGQFHWVILSAEHGHQHELSEALHYRIYRSAAEPQHLYWNALVLGMAELRRVVGRKPDTSPDDLVTATP